MAIGFARLEFVKRSAGKNACAKAAYQSRSKIEFKLDENNASRIYNWSFMESPMHHEIMLPEGADKKFSSKEFLWNAVEKFETRKNSVVAMELLLALPDDKIISDEDKIELTKTFVKEHFVDKGFAAQIDIHRPEKNPDLEKEEHNWHAHVLLSTRRFNIDGQSFEKNKPRDLITSVRNGKVQTCTDNGKLWMHHQNQYFESKGIDLRVDPNGIVSQIHLGPVRMRGRAYSLIEEFFTKQELNVIESLDPKLILNRITETSNIFTKEDVDRFMHKHLPANVISEISEKFWEQEDLVQLLDPKTEEPVNRFTSSFVIEEESKILRIADRLAAKDSIVLSDQHALSKFSSSLTSEQKKAFDNLISGKRISCIAGLAGTGKSHLLSALKKSYENEGYTVRGLGPDNATAMVLKDHGFKESENVYAFLYSAHYAKKELSKNEVWIVDESGKLGSRPLLELLKLAESRGARLVLSGDPLQLPSVERGRMFKTFCKRYGREFLGDIKRQHSEEQRDISKKLAIGNIGAAFDAINRNGGFKWSLSKKDAIESLVKQWAIERELFPRSSSIILAHTNAEMASLNEFVRVYRKARGELTEKEFLCETAYGKIRIGEGDKIQFRKNDRDLGVINGTTGTLIKASPSKFTVRLDGEASNKDVSFNPADHPYFQLGYATTYYRGQGKTIDRAYILHSPYMNKELFYVGLTRHTRKVFCFVSVTEAESLADLKRQAMRASKMESVTDYVTRAELAKQQKSKDRQAEIDQLKSSDSLMSKLHGNTLQVFDKLQSKTGAIIERYTDRLPNNAFFQANLQNKASSNQSVVEIKQDSELSDEAIRSTEIFKPILASFEDEKVQSVEIKQVKAPKKAWEKLPESSKNAFREYYQTSDNASCLHSLVKSEAESMGVPEKNSPHFTEWQQACSKRNETAYLLSRAISQNDLKSVLSNQSLLILKDRSERHENHLARQNAPKQDLEQGLRENLDGLLKQLFPEGPTRSDRQGYRFGSKGSLAVALRGAKEGTYYDFENGEGGGLVKLIQETHRLNHEEAKAWAKNFLGNSSELLPAPQRAFKADKQAEDLWISLKPDSEHPAPELRFVSNYFYQTHNEISRHPYKDASGNLLFYTLRLVDKNDSYRKVVLPLSYGYHQGGDEIPKWSLKGYQSDKKPLYNLDQLYKNPQATVLIVEGEKTADAAQKMFSKDEIVVITWPGGSAASSKADWVPVAFRDIIVWPDNDLPGHKACDQICSELKRLGVNSLKVVDTNILQKNFPEKWDLADPLPKNVSQTILKDLLMNAQDKAVGLNVLLNSLYTDKKLTKVEMLKAQEILWRVDSKLRVSLENEYKGKSWEIQNKIVERASILLLKEDEIAFKLHKEFGFTEERSKAFAFVSMAYQASNGKMLSREKLEDLKKAGHSFSMDSNSLGKDLKDFMIPKYYLACLETGARQRLPDIIQENIVQETIKIEQSIAQQISKTPNKRQISKSSEMEL
jgi:Ti-type conjugative transfer relaxase TraA